MLAKQAQICPVSILSNRPINLDLIKNLKPRIKELVYLIDSQEYSKPDFILEVSRLGIPFRILSTLPQAQINELKLDFMEIGIIHKRKEYTFDDLKCLPKDKDKLFFKSNKVTLARQKIYLSKIDYINDRAVDNFEQIIPIVDLPIFFDELEHFRILKKITA
jgi:hypothetical protein